MKLQRPAGFTLLEAAVVMGLIVILSLGIFVLSQSRFENAAGARTSDEMRVLANMAAVEVQRGLKQVSPGKWTFQPSVTLPPSPITAAQPICYNLSEVEGRARSDCESMVFSRGIPSFAPNWNARYQNVALKPVPSNASLLSTMGDGDRAHNKGYNPWCLPYIVCFYPFRVEILTCVPESLRDNISDSALSCGQCQSAIPGTTMPSYCVVREKSSFLSSSTLSDMSKANDFP